PGGDVRLGFLARTVKRQDERKLALRRRSRRNVEEKKPLLPFQGNLLLRDLSGLAHSRGRGEQQDRREQRASPRHAKSLPKLSNRPATRDGRPQGDQEAWLTP